MDYSAQGIPYRQGDILVLQGSSEFSRAIMFLTKAQASHVGGFINDDPPIILEALQHTDSHPFDVTIANAKRAWILHHKSATPEQRRAIIYYALKFTSDSYGWGDIILQAGDAVLRTREMTEIFSRRLKDHPICSYIWASAWKYGLDFKWNAPLDSITPGDVLLQGQNDFNIVCSEVIIGNK